VRVVFDTNLWISILFDKQLGNLLDLIRNETIEVPHPQGQTPNHSNGNTPYMTVTAERIAEAESSFS